MSKKRIAGPSAVFLAIQVAGAVGVIAWSMIAAGSPAARVETLAFFLGVGGMMLMFHRWRLHGDQVARALCLTAFSTWAVSVPLASVGDAGGTFRDPAHWLAGLALLIGFGGGLTTLMRMYVSRRKGAGLPSKPS